jgi:hypothetical protein
MYASIILAWRCDSASQTQLHVSIAYAVCCHHRHHSDTSRDDSIVGQVKAIVPRMYPATTWQREARLATCRFVKAKSQQLQRLRRLAGSSIIDRPTPTFCIYDSGKAECRLLKVATGKL